MEDGPGVSINRTGGLSSPTCCVMTFCPFLFLRLILASESQTARECALGNFSCHGENTNFRAIPTLTQRTIWPGRSLKRDSFGMPPDTNDFVRGMIFGNKRIGGVTECAEGRQFCSCSVVWASRKSPGDPKGLRREDIKGTKPVTCGLRFAPPTGCRLNSGSPGIGALAPDSFPS